MASEIVKVEAGTALQERERIELIKATVAKGTTDDEFKVFLHVCQKTGLDPFTRQIHAVKRWDSSQKREVMAIQTGIDGYRLIADRTERYVPGRNTEFAYRPDGTILSATAYVKKLVANDWHEISATAFYDEYAQRTKEGDITKFWRDKGHIMLSKCAEALALRKAFPNELSGVYTHEEMQQADLAPAQEKEALGHQYRSTFMGKDVPVDGHVYEMGSHLYCKACTKLFDALPQKERDAFAGKFTDWMKSTDAAGEKIPTIEAELVDAMPVNHDSEPEPDWNELDSFSEGAKSSPQAPPANRQAEAHVAYAKTQSGATGAKISEPQAKRMYAIAKQAGWNDKEMKQVLMEKFGLEHSRDVLRSQYEAICEMFKNGISGRGEA